LTAPLICGAVGDQHHDGGESVGAGSERTRDAMRHKRAKRERVGHFASGYRLAEDGKHIEPNPDEQTVLSEIQRLRHTAIPCRVASELNRHALRTRRGSAWRLKHIARILKARIARL